MSTTARVCLLLPRPYLLPRELAWRRTCLITLDSSPSQYPEPRPSIHHHLLPAPAFLPLPTSRLRKPSTFTGKLPLLQIPPARASFWEIHLLPLQTRTRNRTTPAFLIPSSPTRRIFHQPAKNTNRYHGGPAGEEEAGQSAVSRPRDVGSRDTAPLSSSHHPLTRVCSRDVSGAEPKDVRTLLLLL